MPEIEPLMFTFEDRFGRALFARRRGIAFIVLLIAGAVGVSLAAKAPTADQFAEFQGLKGTEINGRVYRLGESRDCRAIVLVFLATECPISNGYVPDLNSLHQVFHRRGVELYGVLSAPGLSRERAGKHRENFKLRFPVLFDASGELRRRLKATHTPQAFVLSRDGEVIYQGLIDDRYAELGQKRSDAHKKHEYVKESLEKILAGRRSEVQNTTPIGCRLEEAPAKEAEGSVTYNRDIAPIIQGNCSSCHRPGQSAPFSLLTYKEVSGHAEQICEVTQSQLMPPWKAERGFGHFRDERGLTADEIDLLKRWTKAGKPEGENADRPKLPYFADGWQLGQPDLILKMDEAYQLPAGGDDFHQYFVLPINLRENRLISAIEFLPGNPKVVHHAAFYLDTTRTGRRLDAADPDSGYRGFANPGFLPMTTLRNWLPGFTPRHLPQGTGRWLPKGSDLVLEVHYRPSGKVETDQSTIGLHFAPRSSRQMVSELMVLNLDLDIPPGAARHHHQASFTLPESVTLFDAAPHMHLLGREMKAVAHLPNGSTKPLVWIRHWDFNWQEQYEFTEPVRLPQGTRIVVDCYYDNSEGNPKNPNSPPERVKWGGRTKDSMGICHFQFTCDTLRELVSVNREYMNFLASQSAQQRYAGSAEDQPANP
jgi:mono/diheme cytochrome c family protein